MTILRLFATFAIFILFCLPMTIISYPVIALLLLTKWNGRTTPFGNAQWGKGDTNPAFKGRTGYWNALLWLAWRNPVNNLALKTLGVPLEPYTVKGTPLIGDKTAGGFYSIDMGHYWEFYLVKPYNFFGRRCFRARFGWKIMGKKSGDTCQFVCAITPMKPYSGI